MYCLSLSPNDSHLYTSMLPPGPYPCSLVHPPSPQLEAPPGITYVCVPLPAPAPPIPAAPPIFARAIDTACATRTNAAPAYPCLAAPHYRAPAPPQTAFPVSRRDGYRSSAPPHLPQKISLHSSSG